MGGRRETGREEAMEVRGTGGLAGLWGSYLGPSSYWVLSNGALAAAEAHTGGDK